MSSGVKTPCFSCEGISTDSVPREGVNTYVLGRAVHNFSDSNLETKTHVGETRGNHDNPHNFDGGDREDRDIILVLEGETDKQGDGLTNVLSQHVKNELLDVIEHAAAFLNGVENRGEVVVCQYNIGGFLCNIRTSLTHGNADICALERGRIVNTVTCHGDKALAPVESFNHADLGLGSTASNDQWEQRQLVNVVIRKLVKVDSSHDHSLGDIGGDLGHAIR